jgi:hypothetical protein
VAGLELERGNLGAVAELLRAELRPAVAEGVAALAQLHHLALGPAIPRRSTAPREGAGPHALEPTRDTAPPRPHPRHDLEQQHHHAPTRVLEAPSSSTAPS